MSDCNLYVSCFNLPLGPHPTGDDRDPRSQRTHLSIANVVHTYATSTPEITLCSVFAKGREGVAHGRGIALLQQPLQEAPAT